MVENFLRNTLVTAVVLFVIGLIISLVFIIVPVAIYTLKLGIVALITSGIIEIIILIRDWIEKSKSKR